MCESFPVFQGFVWCMPCCQRRKLNSNLRKNSVNYWESVWHTAWHFPYSVLLGFGNALLHVVCKLTGSLVCMYVGDKQVDTPQACVKRHWSGRGWLLDWRQSSWLFRNLVMRMRCPTWKSACDYSLKLLKHFPRKESKQTYLIDNVMSKGSRITPKLLECRGFNSINNFINFICPLYKGKNLALASAQLSAGYEWRPSRSSLHIPTA